MQGGVQGGCEAAAWVRKPTAFHCSCTLPPHARTHAHTSLPTAVQTTPAVRSTPTCLPACLQGAINALAALQEAIKRTGVKPFVSTKKRAAAAQVGDWVQASESVDGSSRDCEHCRPFCRLPFSRPPARPPVLCCPPVWIAASA